MKQKRRIDSTDILLIACLLAIVGFATFLTIFAVWTKGIPTTSSTPDHELMFIAAPVIYFSLIVGSIWLYFFNPYKKRR